MIIKWTDNWKEAKMGRIFKAADNLHILQNRGAVTNSKHVVHLGNHKEFLSKFEYYLDDLRSLVIIADGAKWIWNWADAFYPDATQILDYYHALEHLCEFATSYFKEDNERTTWIEKQKLRLINYYIKNRKRMRYGSFIKKAATISNDGF